MLHSGQQKHAQNRRKEIKQTSQLLAEVQQQSNDRSVENCGAIGELVEEHRMRKRQRDIQKRLLYLQNTDADAWNKRVMMLRSSHTSHIARLVLSHNLLNRRDEIFYYDSDVCVQCFRMYTFNHTTSLNICQHCGHTTKVFFVAEDTSQDILVGKDPLSTGTTSLNSQQKVHTYMRTPLYRRFLRQFMDTAPPVPLEVFRVLYRYMSNVHLQTSIRCRPTPVANILRNQGHAKWANHALVITKHFNGEPIPKLSEALIERLVDRFNYIFHMTTKGSSRHKRIPCFEFITHILLYMEGRVDLAIPFSLHKNRSVLMSSVKCLKDMLPELRDMTGDSMSWENFPEF